MKLCSHELCHIKWHLLILDQSTSHQRSHNFCKIATEALLVLGIASAFWDLGDNSITMITDIDNENQKPTQDWHGG